MNIRTSAVAIAPTALARPAERSAGPVAQACSSRDSVVLGQDGASEPRQTAPTTSTLKTVLRSGCLAALGGMAGGLPLLGAFSAFFGSGISKDLPSRLCGLAALATNLGVTVSVAAGVLPESALLIPAAAGAAAWGVIGAFNTVLPHEI